VSSRMRSTARRAAAGAGALALIVGAAACTGGEDEPPPAESSTTAAPSDGGGQDARSAAPSDGGGTTDPGPFTDQQLDAAAVRVIEALQVIDDQDWATACGFVLDPGTGTAPEGERLQACADAMSGSLGDVAAQLQPGTFDVLEPSMVDATDQGDGTVAVSIAGAALEDVPLVLGADGQWYLSIPF
jgi:hypothetical protein